MIIISTHAVFLKGKDIYGPPHAVSIYLNKNKTDHIFIKHSLYGKVDSLIEYYSKGKLKKSELKKIVSLPLLRYLHEIFISTLISLKAGQISVFIGVNPLNAVSARILKRINRVKKIVYFSADFAIDRFENKLQNRIYHLLDRRAMFQSDQTWSVSKRIVEYRRSKGLSETKNLLLPNAPFFDDVKRLPYSKIDKNDLVIVSAIEKGIAFKLLIDIIAKLKTKIPQVRLHIIGSGSEETEIKKYIKTKGVENDIKFWGPLSHDDMFKVLVKCGIGIAFYTVSDNKHFRYFSDPMKVRDYMASGLPALVSGNPAIKDEIETNRAGFAVQIGKQDMYNSILRILENDSLHQEMRENALRLGKNSDIYAQLKKYFEKLN